MRKRITGTAEECTHVVLLDELPSREFTFRLTRSVNVPSLGRVTIVHRFRNLDRLVVEVLGSNLETFLPRRFGSSDRYDGGSEDKTLDGGRGMGGFERDEGRLDGVVDDYFVLGRERDVRCDVGDSSDA